MKILGFNGSLSRIYEETRVVQHDAAAALIVDGVVVSAIEEERLNRVKHTNKFPHNAITFVLRQYDLQLEDLDHIVYYSGYPYLFDGFREFSIVDEIQTVFREVFGCKINKEKIARVYHHEAHAASTFFMSGFDKSLVLTSDAQGDGIAGLIMDGDGKKLTPLRPTSVKNSLGMYYFDTITVLGYREFDEYKVMGLAPYGDPARYRDFFKKFYRLLPEGNFELDRQRLRHSFGFIPRRKKDEPFTRDHKDIAAALQESLEEIVMHVLKYYKKKYNRKRLCLAGGVALNCTMNGKILASGMFEDVFVQPAAHDAGCAVGAALYKYHQLNPHVPNSRSLLEHVYWGTPVEEGDSLVEALADWKGFIEYRKIDNIAADTARLLAEGAVVGWVQGKSEFGPRALGNRSIIADPRPAKHKDIINQMVKKREAYRPFAPSVLEEYAHRYFELPANKKEFPYMIFVLKVKEDKREILGAVTHVDGTARIQTVSKQTNPKYWQLIDEFRKITGIPVLLNTSFNNNAEPIVDSVHDAVTCFLTTKLNYLVIGDYLIGKKDVRYPDYLGMVPSIPLHNHLIHINKFVSLEQWRNIYEIKNNFDRGYRSVVSKTVFNLLTDNDGRRTLGDLLESQGIGREEEQEAVIEEIIELWTRRFIKLIPKGVRDKEKSAQDLSHG